MKKFGLGVVTGLVAGFFGAGGGLVAVELLRRTGLDDKQAHATSVAVLLPLSAVSGLCYILFSVAPLRTDLLWWALPFGLVGSLVGSRLLLKIKAVWLRRVFGLLMIGAALRLFFR